MAENDYISKAVEELEKLTKADIDQMVEMFGKSPGREDVSNRQQMIDYEALTDEDFVTLHQMRGAESVGSYIVTMERRKRQGRSVRNATPNTT